MVFGSGTKSILTNIGTEEEPHYVSLTGDECDVEEVTVVEE